MVADGIERGLDEAHAARFVRGASGCEVTGQPAVLPVQI